jgi:hypothetical protein
MTRSAPSHTAESTAPAPSDAVDPQNRLVLVFP